MPKYFWLLLLLGVVGIDQALKFWSSSVVVNSGISFSLAAGLPFLTISLTVFAIFACLATFSWARQEQLLVPHALFFAGAFSNIVDRWIFGGVRDIWWVPVLNVHNNFADWCIALAVVWVFVVFVSQIRAQRVQ